MQTDQVTTTTKARRKAKSHKASLKAKREVSPVVSVTEPEGGRAGFAEAAPQAINVPQETAKIKLEVSKMTPSQMLDLLTVVGTGMAATPVYATLPVLTDVNGARTALSTQVLNIQNLETLLREARITLGQWAEACGVVLNRAALACENEDSNPATLVNAGWTLRSGRSPSQDMPAPNGLKLKQTAFAGFGVARWRSVPNARYYEVQVDPVLGAPLTLSQSVTLSTVRVDVPLPEVAPGSLVTLCVRAVGAKGAGPFCDALTVRVN